MQQVFCTQCGTALTSSSKFCAGCGAPTKASVESEPDVTRVADSSHSQGASKAQASGGSTGDTGNSTSTQGTRVTTFLTNRIAFVLLYLLVIAPTYVLPYMGSNSAIVSLAGAAVGTGNLPQFWMHITALYIAFVLAWFRGIYVGKTWIAIFPFFAALFDMLPGFNWLFLVPTGFHVIAVIMGVRGEPNGNQVGKTPFFGAVAVLAVLIGLVVVQYTTYNAAMRGQSAAPTRSPAPSKQFDKDSPAVKLEQFGKKMEEAGKKMEAAAKATDQYSDLNRSANVAAQRGQFADAISNWEKAIPLDRSPSVKCRGEPQRNSILAARATLAMLEQGKLKREQAPQWFNNHRTELWLPNPCNSN